MGDIILGKEVFETIRIKDYNGKVLSEFSFNPSDANIVQRYENFVNSFSDLVKQIANYEEGMDKGEYEQGKEKLQLINQSIHEKMNYLLNTDAAESIFSVMGALSPLPSGDYYFTFILEQIAQKIQSATGSRIQKMDMKIRKHTAKYHG